MTKRSNKPVDVFKNVAIREPSECWEWHGAYTNKGIPSFKIAGITHAAYRVVLSLTDTTFDIKNRAMVVRHKCDNSRCCNPHHLESGTHVENMKDMRQRERHGQSHYVVRAVRKLAKEGRTHQEISTLYGLARQTISDIVTLKTYSEVKDEEHGKENTGTNVVTIDEGGDTSA